MAKSNHNFWALLVGINSYKSYSVPPLTGCVNDVHSLREFLIENMGIPAVQIRTLTNREATRDAILKNFKEFLIDNPSIPFGSQLLFHFSGHGSQMPDSTGTEPDGLSETIVPYNSRTGKVFDIPDKTLAGLIQMLAEKKGENITVILDCCHSGSGTRMLAADNRSVTRRAPVDTRRPPDDLDAGIVSAGPAETPPVKKDADSGEKAATPVENTSRVIDPTSGGVFDPTSGGVIDADPVFPVPGDETDGVSQKTTRSGWAMYRSNHVLVAGCLDREESNEHFPPREEPHGALTWFSLEFLKSKPAGATYADWHAHVMQRVPALFPDQTPQCEGAVNRLVFGDAFVESKPDSGIPEKLLQKSASPFRQQLFLEPAEDEENRLFLDAISRLIVSGGETEGPSFFLEMVETPKPGPLLVVAACREGITIRDEKGALLVSPVEIPARDPAGMVRILESIARFRTILQLDGLASSGLQGKFSLKLLRALEMSGGEITRAGEIEHQTGEPLVLSYSRENELYNIYAQEISNNSGTGVYPHLFVMNPDFSIYRLYPADHQSELLQAGGKVTSGMKGSGGSPLALSLPGDQPGEEWQDESREVLKLIVTTTPCDLGMLEQEPLDIPPPSARRSGSDLNPLESLLASMVSAKSTRGKPIRPSKGDEMATAGIAYTLVREPETIELTAMAPEKDFAESDDLAGTIQKGVSPESDDLAGITQKGLLPEGDDLAGITQKEVSPERSDLRLPVRHRQSASIGKPGREFTLEVPAGFAGRITLDTFGGTRRGLKRGEVLKLPPALTGELLIPISRSASRGVAEQPLVITIEAGEEARSLITPDEPIRVKISDSPSDFCNVGSSSEGEEEYLPIAFDGQDFIPVGYSSGEGEVIIPWLPQNFANSPHTSKWQRSASHEPISLPDYVAHSPHTRGPGGIIRLFIFKKSGIKDKKSGLRIVEQGKDGIIYRDLSEVQFQPGDRIALLIHGFLATSEKMAGDLLPVLASLRPAYTHFLTWDYETFGTHVEENGAALAALLREKCRLAPDDAVTLHVYAHGSGGLVARCMTELSGGNMFTDRMILAGPPNRGTPMADISRTAIYILAGAINNISSIPLAGVLAWPLKEMFEHGEGWKDLTTSSQICQRLNAPDTPITIPWLVLAGRNEHDKGEGARLHRLALKILGKSADFIIGEKENDGMVGLTSMKGIRNGNRHLLKIVTSDDHHFSYFTNPELRKLLSPWLRK